MNQSGDFGDLAWLLKSSHPGSSGYLTVNTRSYVMPDGNLADWDILEGGRTVGIVAVTTDDQILLVRQFRPGPGRVLLELPGGMVEEDEEIERAARRELLEETGYAAESVEVVGQTWLAAYATHQRYAVIAKGCRKIFDSANSNGPKADSLEFIEPVCVSLADFYTHVRSGQLTDTDIAFLALDRLATR